jgi:hypothetical protein
MIHLNLIRFWERLFSRDNQVVEKLFRGWKAAPTAPKTLG